MRFGTTNVMILMAQNHVVSDCVAPRRCSGEMKNMHLEKLPSSNKLCPHHELQGSNVKLWIINCQHVCWSGRFCYRVVVEEVMAAFVISVPGAH